MHILRCAPQGKQPCQGTWAPSSSECYAAPDHHDPQQDDQHRAKQENAPACQQDPHRQGKQQQD
eukprot:8495558-Prorocentrum_lima.AAC.1